MDNDWIVRQAKRRKRIDSFKTETVEEFKQRNGKVTVGPKPEIPTQYTKARNARLNGLWDGTSMSRKGF